MAAILILGIRIRLYIYEHTSYWTQPTVQDTGTYIMQKQ